MNAPLRLFVNALAHASAPRLILCASAAALVAGCAAQNPFATATVDQSSPIAAEVAAKAKARKDYPSFAEIPAMPTDQRPLKAWGRAADEVQGAADQLAAATAPGTWTLTATDSFADRARADAGPALPAGESSATAEAEAFARALRERATPPPSPRN